MKTEQLIHYRDFEEGDLLTDMVWLAENYADDFYNLSDKAGLLYDCMHRLLDMAGRYGFYGNLWHCYLANLLVNKENSYSCSAEIRGSVEGSVNLAALHDIRIFKEFYDYDLQTVAKALGAEEFSIVLFYEGNLRSCAAVLSGPYAGRNEADSYRILSGIRRGTVRAA